MLLLALVAQIFFKLANASLGVTYWPRGRISFQINRCSRSLGIQQAAVLKIRIIIIIVNFVSGALYCGIFDRSGPLVAILLRSARLHLLVDHQDDIRCLLLLYGERRVRLLAVGRLGCDHESRQPGRLVRLVHL